MHYNFQTKFLFSLGISSYPGQMIGLTKLSCGLYHFDLPYSQICTSTSAVCVLSNGHCNDNSLLWHFRLGHLSLKGLAELKKSNSCINLPSCDVFCSV
jgi:hypothetical protein